jgi:hypothetical protein
MLKITVNKGPVQDMARVLVSYEKGVRFSFNRDLPKQLSEDLIKTVRQTIKEEWYDKSPSSAYGLSGGRLRGPSEDNVTLLESFKSRVSSSGRTLKVEAYSTRPYAGIHATGGTIRPSGKYLAIPLQRAMAWPNFDVMKARIIQHGKSAQGPVVLIKSATIKPKPIGSSKNYLQLASDRMAKNVPITVSGKLQNLWSKLTGRFR